jgi:hypothetical protein
MSDPELPADPVAAAKLLRGLASQAPDTARGDVTPWDFLDRLPANVKEQKVRPLLHGLVTDATPIVRALAIVTLTNLPESAATAAKLVEVARKQPTLYRGVSADVYDLGLTLQHALTVKADSREGAAAIAALDGGGPPDVSAMAVVGRYDANGALAMAKRHLAGAVDPRAWANLASAFAMYQRDRLLELLGELSALDGDSRAAVLAECERSLDVSEAHVQAWATQSGNPPPRKPKPSLDECRRALGL